MAFVALQIDKDQILVAAAKLAGKRIQVNHLFAVPIEGDDTQIGEALKEALGKHSLTRSDAIVVVCRGDVEMRELTVPPAPNNELPDMVRFIARSEFATLNDNWALDYFPMSDDEKAQRTVLAAGVSPELQKQLEKIVEPSALRLKHIVMRSYATINLIEEVVNDSHCRLVVDPNGDTTDMSIIDGSKLLATRTVRIPESYDANQRSNALLSEARRTLASSRKMMGDKKVTRVIMFGQGNENKSLEGNLRSHLELETDFVNPLTYAPVASGLKTPESPERYAALLGAMVQHNAGKRHPIDFVNPRRPVVKKSDFTKWYIYGGLAAAMFLFCIIGSWLLLRSQSLKNRALEDRANALQRINNGDGNDDEESVEQILGEIKKIDDWKTAEVNWLEEFYQYSDRALTPDDAIVDLFDAVVSTRADVNSKITVKTRLSKIDKEEELIDALNERPFIVDQKRGGVSVDPKDKDYPLNSTFNVSLTKDDFLKLKEVSKWADNFLQKRNQRILNNNQPKPTGKQ